jgi:hypothetical protein
MITFPPIKDIATELLALNPHVCGNTSVRLQVKINGSWSIHFGKYKEIDQSGYWGEGVLPGQVNFKIMPIDSFALAKKLLTQVEDNYLKENPI